MSGLILPCKFAMGTQLYRAAVWTNVLISCRFWASNSSAQWRVPIALQIIFALIMVIAINYVGHSFSVPNFLSDILLCVKLPESPRWFSHLETILNPFSLLIPLSWNRLLKAGRPAEALAIISALEDKDPSDESVKQTFEAIREAVIIESFGQHQDSSAQAGKQASPSLRELFTGGRTQNFRRVCLGVVIQCFQQVLTSEPADVKHTHLTKRCYHRLRGLISSLTTL